MVQSKLDSTDSSVLEAFFFYTAYREFNEHKYQQYLMQKKVQ